MFKSLRTKRIWAILGSEGILQLSIIHFVIWNLISSLLYILLTAFVIILADIYITISQGNFRTFAFYSWFSLHLLLVIFNRSQIRGWCKRNGITLRSILIPQWLWCKSRNYLSPWWRAQPYTIYDCIITLLFLILVASGTQSTAWFNSIALSSKENLRDRQKIDLYKSWVHASARRLARGWILGVTLENE